MKIIFSYYRLKTTSVQKQISTWKTKESTEYLADTAAKLTQVNRKINVTKSNIKTP